MRHMYGSNFPCPIGAPGTLFGFRGSGVKNQEGGLWPLRYMESWNHMAHGPCIHEYFH